jgi:hypothetical protein
MRPYLEKLHHKKRAGGVAQGLGHEFKPQYWEEKKKKRIRAEINEMETKKLQRINETESWFFEKICKIGKVLDTLKGRRSKLIKLEMGGNITINTNKTLKKEIEGEH